MRVGILTFPHAPSLGAMLQMGALYHLIETLGHEVEIINYVSDKVNYQIKLPITAKSIIIKVISKFFLKSPEPSYREFRSKLKMYPAEPTFSEADLEKINRRFERIIVGSDQVWNPDVTGHDLAYFLDFCHDKSKKASYAASFGYMHVDETAKAKIAELLNDFTYLGVREKQGQKIVRDLTGREAVVVLDPTLLVDSSYLRREMKKCSRKSKYVLFFCIKPSNTLYSIAQEYANENGYEFVTIGGKIKDRFDPRRHAIYGTGPKEFLGLIDGAQCVFTNSFHGMAISIALHTDFFVEYSSDTNSRLSNVIDMLHLHDRVVNATVPQSRNIDFDTVEEILNVERKKSLEYLQSIVD